MPQLKENSKIFHPQRYIDAANQTRVLLGTGTTKKAPFTNRAITSTSKFG